MWCWCWWWWWGGRMSASRVNACDSILTIFHVDRAAITVCFPVFCFLFLENSPKKLQQTTFFLPSSSSSPSPFCNSVVRPPLSRQHRCVFSSRVAGTLDTYSLEEVSLVAAGALERRVARAACPVRKWHRYASAPATPTPQKTKKGKSTECSDVPIEFHLIVTSREGGLSHRHVFISHTHGIPRINKL